jgi:hypothetical protein
MSTRGRRIMANIPAFQASDASSILAARTKVRDRGSYQGLFLCYTIKHKDNTDMADLNQFLNQGLAADDIAHSNGYGAIAGGGGAGGLSMDQRRKILNQPRVVGSYQYSRLGRQGSALKARTANEKLNNGRVYDASKGSFEEASTFGTNRQHGGIKDQAPTVEKSVDRRQHFVEPPSRNYDKYA